MNQTLYVLQGPSGCGKSTLAELLANGFSVLAEFAESVICSTDAFFHENGTYNFRPEKLGEFHAKNLQKAKDAMDHGSTVIVDNTNIKRWESREYVKYAVSKGIPVVFIRVTGDFQTTHGVPPEAVKRMRESMETLTVESVLASKTPWEK